MQLAQAADDRRLDLAAILVGVDDGAGIGIHFEHRHLQHAPGFWAERQERAVGLAALWSERRQHNVLYRLVVAQHLQQRGIEAAGGVPVGRRLELVLETEGVERSEEHTSE